MQSADARARAGNLLSAATFRLAWEYPLHARLLAQLRFDPDRTTASMTLGVSGVDISFSYRPEFVAGLNLDQCLALLLHALNHVLFGHLGMTAESYPNATALVVAQEVTANEWVDPGLLPHEAVTLQSYPRLPEGEDTITRYDRLCARREAAKDHRSDDGGRSDTNPGPSDLDVRDRPPRAGADQRRDQLRKASAITMDDHDGWQAPGNEAPLAASLAKGIVLEAVAQLTDRERSRVDSALLDQLSSLEPGSVVGTQEGPVASGGSSFVPWQRVLRRFIGTAVESDYSTHWPSRRAPHLVGVVPGRRTSPGSKRLMAVIDTSGSVTSEELRDIAAELRKIATRADVTVVQCDATIHDISPFRGRLDHVAGRGGTDFCPPFDRALLKRLKPDAVIYFTDGDGPAPEEAPRVPVLWCITADGEKPAPWGLAARMGPRTLSTQKDA